MKPTHNISMNLLVNGTQAVINHQSTASRPGMSVDEIASSVRSMFTVPRPTEDVLAKDRPMFVGMRTAPGLMELCPERLTLLSVEVIEITKMTEVKAHMMFTDQVLVPNKAQQLANQLPNIMMPGRA